MNETIHHKKIMPWLYRAQVLHHRFIPKSYFLNHEVYYIRFPLSQMNHLKNIIFSINRWNLFSFNTKDHGNRDGSDLREWAILKLKEAEVTTQPTEIELQTFPRILGFVFNPVSFWYCYDGTTLFAILVEVNNTFGSTYTYVIKDLNSQCLKQFHVSPFLKVSGFYQFNFSNNGQKNTVKIDYYDQDQKVLTTQIAGVSQAYNVQNLFRLWLSHPMMTFMIVFYIHLHAVFLYLKGIPFTGKKG